MRSEQEIRQVLADLTDAALQARLGRLRQKYPEKAPDSYAHQQLVERYEDLSFYVMNEAGETSAHLAPWALIKMENEGARKALEWALGLRMCIAATIPQTKPNEL